MKTLRHRTWLVLLTLVAFSAQSLFAGSHIHHDRGSGIQSRAMTAGICAISTKSPCAPAPHQHDQGCVLCWAANVTSASLIPDLPALPPAPQVQTPRVVAFIEAVPRAVRGENFRARAPPIAAFLI